MHTSHVTILLFTALLAGAAPATASEDDPDGYAGLPLATSSAATTGQRPTIVSAHRGGAAYAPENTMVAFRNAVRLGADDLEADALLTADGQLVLIHDDTLDRTTSCKGFVATKNYDEIALCDAAHWFSPGEPTTKGGGSGDYPLRGAGIGVPLVTDLFDYMVELYAADRRVPTATVELKIVPDQRDEQGAQHMDHSAYPSATELVRLINLPEYALIRDRIIVQSFWPPALDLVKQLDPTIRTLFLTTRSVEALATENLLYTTARDHDIVSPEYKSRDFQNGFGAQFVAAAHAAHKRVIPWTLDTADDMRTFIGFGVDGMITNFPACLLQLQGRLADGTKLTPDVPNPADPEISIEVADTAACK